MNKLTQTKQCEKDMEYREDILNDPFLQPKNNEREKKPKLLQIIVCLTICWTHIHKNHKTTAIT